MQAQPSCPMQCRLTSSNSMGSSPHFITAFDSQTGDLVLSTQDANLVGTTEKLTLECESTASHMPSRVAKASFSVTFTAADQSKAIQRAHDCSSDTVAFRTTIGNFAYSIGQGEMTLA